MCVCVCMYFCIYVCIYIYIHMLYIVNVMNGPLMDDSWLVLEPLLRTPNSVEETDAFWTKSRPMEPCWPPVKGFTKSKDKGNLSLGVWARSIQWHDHPKGWVSRWKIPWRNIWETPRNWTINTLKSHKLRHSKLHWYIGSILEVYWKYIGSKI